MTCDQWISFKVEAERYLHSIDKIKEIIPYTPPAPVPGSPRCTEGVLNVRGNVITILSGRSLFNRQKNITHKGKRIIVLDLGADQIGISVDSIGEIITFQSNQAQWTDQSEQNPLIKGTLQLNKQFYILLNFSDHTLFKDEKQ
ncbi:MAG: purine-binding chemotaxis protein CheW [Candidatus Endobugula sp.]